MKYAEIVNNNVVTIHEGLPQTYRNISNFFALELEKIKDLSWSGNDVKFYEYIDNKPENLAKNVALVGPTYSIDHDTYKVIGSYGIQQISEPPVGAPQTISARQVRLWLIDNNISLTGVEAAIDSIVDEKLREKTRVEWEFAPYIDRNHSLVNTIGQILGLNADQIDQAFIVASQL